MQQAVKLIKKGAEADIFLTDWNGRMAISKLRSAKPYRHKTLDLQIRKQRTIHEAEMMSAAKLAGVAVPHVFFVDSGSSEIMMEFIEGKNARDALSPNLCREIGRYTAMIHAKNIIHGDLATSNFIVGKKLFMIDFGLSHFSERTEDRAVDIRLIKQVFGSAHASIYEKALENFADGYSQVVGEKKTKKILENVAEIEQRGRYARMQ